MIKIYIFAICAAVVFGSTFGEDPEKHSNWELLPHDVCGQVDSQRIIGGKNAALNAYPWIARIGYVTSKSKKVIFLCGGVLANSKVVLTAAHCVVDLPDGYSVGIIRLGEHNTETDPDCDGNFCSEPVLDVAPSEILIPENYDVSPYKHDLALIRLKKEIKFSSSIKPICFGDGEFTRKNFVGRLSEVAGWGIFDIDNYKTSTILQVVKLSVMKNEECVKHYSDFTNIGLTQICVGGTVGKDSCNGDSGGPLMIVDDGVNGPAYFLLGIVSFGHRKCGKTDIPAVYTKMPSYMEWFLNNLVEKTVDSKNVL